MAQGKVERGQARGSWESTTVSQVRVRIWLEQTATEGVDTGEVRERDRMQRERER